jgi:hypothetical protein
MLGSSLSFTGLRGCRWQGLLHVTVMMQKRRGTLYLNDTRTGGYPTRKPVLFSQLNYSTCSLPAEVIFGRAS